MQQFLPPLGSLVQVGTNVGFGSPLTYTPMGNVINKAGEPEKSVAIPTVRAGQLGAVAMVLHALHEN